MDDIYTNLNNNISNNNNNNNMINSSSYTEINLEVSTNQNQSEEVFKDIVDNFLQKKLSKENELKYQIEQNKKNILEKFYSLSNNDYIEQETKNKLQDADYDFSQQNDNNPKTTQNQEEYDEIREKYKNERNKKKSSIFKSEDLRINNTDIVHIKKEDYSPINPNVVDIENKNNILIIQKKLFGENEDNDELEGMGTEEKIEDIDEIELDFSEINNNKYEESEIISNNNKNNNYINYGKQMNNKFYQNNEEMNINYFSNEILFKKREIDLCFIAMKKSNINNSNGINKYNKHIQRNKNYSVQLVSSIGYFNNNSNNSIINKRKDNNSLSNNINNINFYGNNEANKENNFILNYLRNNNPSQNNTTEQKYINGNITNNNDNSENDNSNNTIVRINNNNNNNNYNGKYCINDMKLLNGSNLNQKYINQKNNIYEKKFIINEYKTLKNKNSNFKNNISYIDYKNFSGRLSQKNLNKINLNGNNIKKQKILPIKKKNNSFVLHRDNSIIKNNNIKKQIYQTLNNNKNNSMNNNNYNYSTHTHTHSHTQKNLLNYNNNTNNGNSMNNKIIPIISKIPISVKVKKNLLPKIAIKNNIKNNNNKKMGNKISLLNTLLNNNLILFQKPSHQHEAIEKLKARPNNGVYFIYVDKVNEGYSFKGIYKRGPSEINHICNKIYGIPNTPLMLCYEKFYILVENEEKKFEFKKLRDINVLSFVKTIILIKNK